MVGKIDIQNLVEHEDGSATIVFDCDIKTKELLIGMGLVSLLEKAINKQDGYDLADQNQLEFDFDD